MKRLLLTVCALLWAGSTEAQVPVSLAPYVHQQFVDGTGKVLANGFVYTYAAGTTTRQDTFTDSTGSIANAWPIPLDATGSPSNGSTQTGIWLSNNTYKFCAVNSALVQQWCVDNVSAYSILNNIQNITFGSVTSDPTGAAGELGYRSDIPCFRGYTTFWDCFVRLTDIQTLTNKTVDISVNTLKTATNTAGHYPRNNGSTGYVDSAIQSTDFPANASFATPVIAGVNAQSGISYTFVAADEQRLVTFSNSSAVAVTLPQATTSGFGSGTVFHVRNLGTGAVTITPTTSTIDGAATLVVAGGQGADIYSDGTNYESQKGAASGAASTVIAANLTGQTANVAATTLTTPLANGFYRFTCYTVITTAAATSSQLPGCQVNFTDADSSAAEGVGVTSAPTTNTVGTVGGVGTGTGWIYAKSGVAIQYLTQGYASNPASTMQYAVHVRLEGPF